MEDFHLKERPSVEEAIRAADAAKTLPELYQAIEAYQGHDVAKDQHYTPSQTVNIDHPIMIVSEKPEEEDAKEGAPFSGEYGSVMRNAVKQSHVNIRSLHIAYAIHWTPPKGKTVNKTQIAASRPFLFKEIELVQPRAILAQGKAVMEALSGYRGNILEIAGQSMDFKWRETQIPMFIMTHPKYCLFSGTHFADFQENVSRFFELYGKKEEGSFPGSFNPETIRADAKDLSFKRVDQMRAA